MKRWAAPVLVLALAGGAASLARAEVWGFVDDKGVAHFASEKLDMRYELFFRGNETGAPSDPDAVALPRAVAVPTVAPRLIAYFEVSPSYKQVKHHLREAATLHGVDYELLKAVIATESGFDADAVSPKGAIGLMQVMPATAERYGLAADGKLSLPKKLADPRTNIRTGTRYLRYLIDLFPGRLELALAAYNAGEGAVQRAGNRIPNFRETQNYVKTVMQLYGMLKPPVYAASPARALGRIRVELPGLPDAAPAVAPLGGAVNRGNMVSQPARPSQPSQRSLPAGATVATGLASQRE
ncbi:MAG TPA: lytic transglycosylase domain-containing protein [Ramlibacter sp.]|nr:lytic transglycosylase domain-containing protein [Ramlibacter sp.]